MFITPEDSADSPECIARTVATACAAVRGGCGTVVVRVPTADTAARAHLASALLSALTPAQPTNGSTMQMAARVIIGDGDVRAAAACTAHGVHLPERCAHSADAVHAARAQLVRGALVGASAHSVEGARSVAGTGVDYLLLGSMFYTQTHPETVEVEGLRLMRDVRLQLDADDQGTVLIGIGGIDGVNCGEVMASGGDGVAVIRGLSEAPSPSAAAAAILVTLAKTGC